ncbi:outer membrane protein assembly factor BamD [Succinivibrio dextrinosolvens]|uniref:outer membrane protein assembly factor BamD n=1 Tax=Succinivibrio dextrinosolvens TaxID=83771 RepID=UPI00068DCB56|nr:outer membrane protein assembly factor BamD [Succinivibrio dextrinosolvens]
MFKKILMPFVIATAIAVTGCSSDKIEKDAVPDLSQEALHAKARQMAASGDYAKARDYLEALDSRYPFGELTDQVQLDLIYVNYKSRKSAETTAAIERFLRLNPNSQYADYVLYMKGLNEMQKHGSLIQDFLGFDRSQKDPQNYFDAYKAFKDLIDRYPNSPYATDAYHRLVYIKTQLAKREWAIASYYQERGALVSAIRHCQAIIYTYYDTEYCEKAFKMMAEDYKKLGLQLPSSNAEKVIAASTFEKK